MEIAKLEALITADIKPLTAALDQAQTEIGQFASEAELGFTQLSQHLSETAQKALQNANNIQSVTEALNILKAEQAGIQIGTQQWKAYQVTIEGVEGALKKAEGILPEVGDEAKKVGTDAAKGASDATGGFTKMYNGLKTIANIIPGLGISGIFLGVFEAISFAADELGIFKDKTEEEIEAAKKAAEETKKFADSMDQAKSSAISSALSLNSFVSIAKDSLLPLSQRNEALREANKILGEHGEKLNLVNINTQKGTELINDFTNALLAEAVASKFTDQAADLIVKQRNLLKTINDAKVVLAGISTRAVPGETTDDVFKLMIKNQKLVIDSTKEYNAVTNQLKITVLDLNDAQLTATELFGKIGTKAKGAGKDIKDVKDEYEKLIKSLEGKPLKQIFMQWADPTDLTKLNEQLTKTPALLNQLPSIDKFISGIKSKKALEDFNKQMETLKTISSEVANIFSNLFVDILTTGKFSFKQLAQEVARFVAQLVEAVIQTALLKFLMAALTGGGSAGASAITSFFNKGGVFLAGGGIVNSPTLAMIGEGGPEAVIPLSQMQNMSSGMSNNVTINGVLRVQGGDLVLALNRSNVRINRNNGSNFN